MRHLGYRLSCRWQRWLAVRRAEHRLSDLIVTGGSHADIGLAYDKLREAREL